MIVFVHKYVLHFMKLQIKKLKNWNKIKIIFNKFSQPFITLVFRIDFLSDKSRLGSGKKRAVVFQSGASHQEQVLQPPPPNSDWRIYYNM
jgi:hypothetical protein